MERTNRVWAMIDADFHQDDTIAAIAEEHGPRALTYWTVFICESKKVHRGKAEGWAGPFTLAQFAALCYDDKSRRSSVQKLVEAFVKAGLLELTYVHGSNTLGRWKSRPSNFLALQKKGNNAFDQTSRRHRLQGFCSESQDIVSDESAGSQTIVRRTHARAEVDVDVYRNSPLPPNPPADDKPATTTTAPKQVIAMKTAELNEWRGTIRSELARFVADDQLDFTVDRVWWKAKSLRYPADQWVWACRLTAEAIERGTEVSDVLAYIGRVVPGAGPPVGVRDGVVGSGRPEVVARSARLAELEELERRYSGGGAA